jgi:CHAT domain-containing protein
MVTAEIRPLLGGARHLLVSPDGALNLLPFDLLVDEEGRYLVERYQITYLTSGRDLLRLGEPFGSQSGPVIIADPDYDEGGAPATSEGGTRSASLGETTWRRLPGTAEEAAAITRLLGDVTTLVGADATEEALKALHGPRILHLATHGFFLADQIAPHGERGVVRVDRDAPESGLTKLEDPLLRSGLVLSGANLRKSQSEDGIVTASEVSGLDLWGTKLVVLSACESGVGEVKNGRGVYGLRRTLVLAGAESLVMSLWQVADQATRDLMVRYYTYLRDGHGRTDALRRARLDLLAGKRWRHPYYWAAFVPSGDWRTLEGAEPRIPELGRGKRGCGCRTGDDSTAATLALAVVACCLASRRRRWRADSSPKRRPWSTPDL